mmetsp:Transcript_23417/g.42002  ORF Transcript_23417/g.42002 Transcript_23417/m.42002 type:complete len:120 (-) Transcript_23417:13-372(-)
MCSLVIGENKNISKQRYQGGEGGEYNNAHDDRKSTTNSYRIGEVYCRDDPLLDSMFDKVGHEYSFAGRPAEFDGRTYCAYCEEWCPHTSMRIVFGHRFGCEPLLPCIASNLLCLANARG